MTRPPPNILYVITDLEVGGVPLHLHRLVKTIRERGYSCTVVSLLPAGEVGRRLRSDGVTVLSCDGRGGFDVRVIKRLARIMAQIKPDLVHAMLFHANLASRRAARRVGILPERIICEIQTVEVERRWHLAVDRWTHRGCHFTIGNSQSVIDHLAAHARIPRDRLRLVRGGIDPTPFQSVAPTTHQTLGVQAGASIVLWVGRLDPVKGLPQLIDAFGPVARECDAHLLLVGDGPVRDKLVRLVAQRGLDEHVHLLGVRDDVATLLKTCDLFVLPSRTEGLANALLEAMAASCPIVATDVPGNHDLIENESDGLLVPFGDVAALTGAMLRLLRDSVLARRMGDAAFTKVTKNWHMNTMFESYEAIYREVLNDDETDDAQSRGQPPNRRP